MFLLFQPGPPVSDDEAAAEVDRAIADANDAVPPRTIVGGSALRAVHGVVVNLFWDGQDGKVIRPWLTTFTDHLTADGLSGTVSTSRAAPDLTGFVELDMRFPTAFVGYRIAEYIPRRERLRGWLVDPDTTERVVTRAISSASQLPNSECWAYLSAQRVELRRDQALGFLCSSAAVSSFSKTVLYRGGNPVSLSQVGLTDVGEFTSQRVVLQSHWQPMVEAMSHMLLIAPEAADVGMIKNVGARSTSWQRLDSEVQQPVRMVMDYENSRHLWDEYVIDAHGISLLTDKHLDHANDLSNWTIEKVAPQRYLVSAADLEPWFGQRGPDEATLAQARADFGDMILNWDTILARRGPYTSRNTAIVGR